MQLTLDLTTYFPITIYIFMQSGSLVEGYTFITKIYSTTYYKTPLMLDSSFNVRGVLNSFIKS